MKLRIVAAPAALALYLTACTGSPPPQTDLVLDIDTPETYPDAAVTDSALQAVGMTWWEDFGEPDLNDLIAEALVRNHNLQAAVGRVEQSVALAQIAGADIYPQLNLQAGASRTKQNFVGLPIPGAEGEVLTNTSNNFNLGLALSWELDLWGRIRSGKSAALADVQAAFADYYGVRLSVASQTTRAWIQLISARLLLDLADDTVESFDRTANQVRERYERGLRTSLDLRLALTNLANAQAAQVALERAEENAARRLELLLGRYPGGSLEYARELPDAPASVPAELPAALLSRRPDLASVERRVAAAGMRVSEAKAALYPRISLTASGGTSSNELKDLVSTDFFVWNLAANLFQPIFQGGRLRANVRLNEARAREASELYASQVLSAYAEVESAITADTYLARQLEYVEEATRQARAAEATADRQYRAGLIDFITLQESQRRRIQAEVDLISVKAQRITSRVDLYLALGGGFNFDPSSTDTTPVDADTPAHEHRGS